MLTRAQKERSIIAEKTLIFLEEILGDRNRSVDGNIYCDVVSDRNEEHVIENQRKDNLCCKVAQNLG